jgi:hypothetical protein
VSEFDARLSRLHDETAGIGGESAEAYPEKVPGLPAAQVLVKNVEVKRLPEPQIQYPPHTITIDKKKNSCSSSSDILQPVLRKSAALKAKLAKIEGLIDRLEVINPHLAAHAIAEIEGLLSSRLSTYEHANGGCPAKDATEAYSHRPEADLFRQASQLSTEAANASLPHRANGSSFLGEPSRPISSTHLNGTEKLRHKKRDVPLPDLPPGLRWPEAKFNESGVDIVTFLEKHWLPLIEAGIDGLRWIRHKDQSAIEGIKNFERVNPKTGKRERLPQHLQLLRRRQLTDRELNRELAENGREAIKGNEHLAVALAYRLKNGHKVPNF